MNLIVSTAWSWEPHRSVRRFLNRQLKSGEIVTRYILDMETMGRAANLDEKTIRILFVDGTGFNAGLSLFISQSKNVHELRIGIEDARELLNKEARQKQTGWVLKKDDNTIEINNGCYDQGEKHAPYEIKTRQRYEIGRKRVELLTESMTVDVIASEYCGPQDLKPSAHESKEDDVIVTMHITNGMNATQNVKIMDRTEQDAKRHATGKVDDDDNAERTLARTEVEVLADHPDKTERPGVMVVRNENDKKELATGKEDELMEGEAERYQIKNHNNEADLRGREAGVNCDRKTKPTDAVAIIGHVSMDEKIRECEMHDRIPIRGDNTEQNVTKTAEGRGEDCEGEKGLLEATDAKLAGDGMRSNKLKDKQTTRDNEEEDHERSVVIGGWNGTAVDDFECCGGKNESTTGGAGKVNALYVREREERDYGRDSLMVERKQCKVDKNQERMTEQIDGNVMAMFKIASPNNGEVMDHVTAVYPNSGKAIASKTWVPRVMLNVDCEGWPEQGMVVRKLKSTTHDPGGPNGNEGVTERVDIRRRRHCNWRG